MNYYHELLRIYIYLKHVFSCFQFHMLSGIIRKLKVTIHIQGCHNFFYKHAADDSSFVRYVNYSLTSSLYRFVANVKKFGKDSK